MSRLGWRSVVLVVVAVLAAIGLTSSTAVDGTDGQQHAEPAASRSNDLGAPAVDSPQAPLAHLDRREPAGQGRAGTQRLVVLVALVAIAATIVRRRRAVIATAQPRPLESWWRPDTGRAPPFFPLLIV